MNFDELELPDDWMLTPIAEVFDFTSKPRGLDLSQFGDTVPFVPMELIPIGRITATKFTPRPQADLGSGTYVEDGDLMVAKITPSFENGKQGILQIGEPFAFGSTEVIPVHGREGISETRYLFFYLLHPEIRSSLAGKMEGSTGRQRLSKAVLGDCLIPLPPLAQQKEIIQTLSAVQRAIEAQERIIQTTTELKQALMQKLFSEGLRGEPQKETEIGLAPENWDVVELGSLFAKQPQNGLYKPKSEYGSGTQILRIDDFSNDGDVVTGAANCVLLEPSEIETYGLEPGDIVINRVNSLSHLGKTALIGDTTEVMVFESNMMRFSVDASKAIKEFIFRYLNSPLAKNQIVGSAKRAVAQSSINQGDVKAIIVPKPTLQEQTEIVTTLEAVEAKVAHASNNASALRDLFHTLLHELMTAKNRVHELGL